MKTRLRGLARRLATRTGPSDVDASLPDGPQEPIVSLTFDDGLASHRIAPEPRCTGPQGHLLRPQRTRRTQRTPGLGRPARTREPGLRDRRPHEQSLASAGADGERCAPRNRVRPACSPQARPQPLTFAYPFGESLPLRILSACAPRTVPAAGRPRSSSLHSLSSARTKPAG